MSLCIIIRHGERADDGSFVERQAIKLPYDPHLTPQGIKQADQTGIYLKQYLSGRKITLVTSPFLRCIQTCEEINKHLNSDIFISVGLGECFKTEWFDRDILSELPESGYKKVPYEEVIQQYPETMPQFFGRFVENYKRCREHFGDVIIITHGYGVNCINMLAKQLSGGHIEYCSISIVEGKKMTLNNSIAHLPKL